MGKSGEQISIGHVARLAIAYLKSCFTHFTRLEDQVLELIGFEKEKFTSIHKITSEWFDKDFLEVVLGIKELISSDDSSDLISELRKIKLYKVYGLHQGKRYEAEITEDSKIKTLHNGIKYDSLSAAASEIRGYQENGWRFWKYKYGDDYVRLITWREAYLKAQRK